MSREEFNGIIKQLNDRANVINDLLHNQEVQFKRLAQLQAELDAVKQAWNRLRLNA